MHCNALQCNASLVTAAVLLAIVGGVVSKSRAGSTHYVLSNTLRIARVRETDCYKQP